MSFHGDWLMVGRSLAPITAWRQNCREHKSVTHMLTLVTNYLRNMLVKRRKLHIRTLKLLRFMRLMDETNKQHPLKVSTKPEISFCNVCAKEKTVKITRKLSGSVPQQRTIAIIFEIEKKASQAST